MASAPSPQPTARRPARIEARSTQERLSLRLDPDRRRRLIEEAAASGRTQSAILRHALDEHWALQDELAGPAGEPGDPKTGRLIHTLLAETEERIAGSYEASLRRLHTRLDLLLRRIDLVSVMVSQAYFAYLSHTPPIPDDLRASAIASARERHRRWEDCVLGILSRGTPPISDR